MRYIYLLIISLMAMPAWAATDLTIYSGAGLMKPMEALRTNFEKDHNVEIKVHYGGSGEIFGMLGMGKCCDVFIPGAEKYTNDAKKNGWLKPGTDQKIVKHIPVIVVPKGNPANIQTLADLGRKDVKITLGDPRACAIGKISKKLLEKNKLYDQVKPQVVVSGPTVNQLLIYVAMNRVQAAIIWEDVVAWAEDKVEVIRIPDQDNIIKTVPCSVTNCSPNPALAQEFTQYISSDKAMAVWEKWGFERCTD
ncbi:MAG: molybdate ABC transporter substrate-binding protein [Desulfobacter sp.]|nr:molybdate ABC transporter substrate-binding protein [Desulfobacter sp.]WDP85874.1 MAG: molybdate ABC transporter substrate-binding protein [Desulfobacter sp.]